MEKSRKTARSECTLTVHVVPRSSRISVTYQSEKNLKVKLTAPPVEGAANRQLIEVLSKLLTLPRKNLEIISGLQSKTKTIRIYGITEERVRETIGE